MCRAARAWRRERSFARPPKDTAASNASLGNQPSDEGSATHALTGGKGVEGVTASAASRGAAGSVAAAPPRPQTDAPDCRARDLEHLGKRVEKRPVRSLEKQENTVRLLARSRGRGACTHIHHYQFNHHTGPDVNGIRGKIMALSRGILSPVRAGARS